jgi:TRAP-type mannitol/chloroaromatic compound transport system substrate-binding protein
MPKQPAAKKTSRRKFLTAAGAGALAAPAFMPAVARGQSGPIGLRMQTAWPAKEIFHTLALDFAQIVNDASGGDLKIEIVPVGTVAPATDQLDAVSKGTLDGAHGAMSNAYAKSAALALWGSGPSFGMDANMLLAWHKTGGGRELLEKVYSAINVNVVSFPYAPLYTRPLGWFGKPVTKAEDFKGLKFGATGIGADVFTAMGAEVKRVAGNEAVVAMADGSIEAAESEDPSSDRELGFASAAKICMLQSYHRSAEQLEILFNKARFNALPAKLRAVLGVAVDAASQNAMWKMIDFNSHDFAALQGLEKVHSFKTPNTVLLKELDSYDEVLAKKTEGNSLIKEILESQKKFAERAVRWDQETIVNRRLAYDHYFNRPTPPAPKKTDSKR